MLPTKLARTLFAAVDAYYPPGGGARSAIVVARQASFAELTAEWTADLAEVPGYQPGQFFLREPPPRRPPPRGRPVPRAGALGRRWQL